MAAGDSADLVRRRGRGAQVLAAAAVPPLERQPARGRPGERGGGRAHRLPADGKVVDVEDLGRDRGEVGPRCGVGWGGVASIGGRGEVEGGGAEGGRWHQIDEPRQLRRVRNVDLPRGRSAEAGGELMARSRRDGHHRDHREIGARCGQATCTIRPAVSSSGSERGRSASDAWRAAVAAPRSSAVAWRDCGGGGGW